MSIQLMRQRWNSTSAPEDRKMLLLRLLPLLSLTFCQAAAEGESTQVYYTSMTVDKNAWSLILKKLQAFQVNDGNKVITNVTVTTSCTKGDQNKVCVCSQGNKWSNQVIQSNNNSCNESVCTLPNDSTHTCMSSKTVKVAGSITLSDNSSKDFKDCLLPQESDAYKTCKDKVESALKEVYSTLSGLDTFNIVDFRTGSVIVDFEMTVVNGIKASELVEKSKNLTISNSMALETTGMVTVIVPNNTVPYKTNSTVICKTVEDLNLEPNWMLRRDGLSFSIYDGTVSNLINQSSTEFQVKLKVVDKYWTGEYDCSFRNTSSNITVTHRANATIDMCLLPDILNSVEPAFPLCTSNNQLLFVTIKCQIAKSSEKYTVTWPSDYLKDPLSNDSDTLTYSARKLIDCSIKTDTYGTCTFTNRCNQIEESRFNITVIHEHDSYCRQENEWQNTKAGFTAVLNCKGMSGVRKRKCNSMIWEDEVSECVVLSLKNVLEKAVIADSGLGNLEKNAAEVLQKFSNLTKTENLASQANIKASVSVYGVLDGKISAIENTTTVENFLDSSSNLLNTSLASSWSSSFSSVSREKNDSILAENYLLSLENLINKSNILEVKEKENLIVKNCPNGTCDGLFNISVSLTGSVTGDIKTVAYKNLQNYLPNNDTSTQKINSLVVSTTAKVSGEMSIVIDFQLQTPRPRDVELKCVYWNKQTHDWSGEGCSWEGPSSEGRCICKHLSSFAILMSKTPLRVPALSLLTTAGLSISIASLIISLTIEMIVWQQVVKTNTLYLRHTAHINISLCLLVADICFLASSKPDGNEGHGQTIIWCRIFAVMKHFCYLAMFFWMLALSTTLLHQAVFLFHKVSKKTYLRFSIFLGYICPLLIVFITFLANNAGDEGSYFLKDTCWLVYAGLLKGSMFTFIIPMGIIVFFNTFSMLVVIMKLLEHHKNDDTQNDKEKAAAKTVIRSVVLLTPIFGLTWAFGLLIMILDLTSGPVAYAVNYVFIILNAFQGFYILLTTCLGDKMTREALLSHLKKKNVTNVSTSTVKTETSWKK